MTPKEKARELVEKFYSKRDALGLAFCVYWSNAKQCALIAVDEILDELDDPNGWGIDTYSFGERINYWNKVKQEIEKL